MINKLSSLLHREWNSLHEAAIIMGGFAIVTQIFSLFRDRVLAATFGAGQVLDLYFAALRVPDFLFAAGASIMSTLIIVPLLAKHATDSDARGQKYLNDIFTIFFSLLVLIAVGLFIVIPILVPVVYRGLDLTSQMKLVTVTRVLLLAPIFFALSNLFSSVTQTLNKLSAFIIAPALYNLGIILGALYFYPAFGLLGLAWGAVVAAFLNFFVHFYISSRNGFDLTFSFKLSFTDLWDTFRIALPRTIWLVISQLVLFAFIIFAIRMEPGSVAIFSFSFNLQSAPLLIIGYSYAIAAFPTFSRHLAVEDVNKFVEQISNASRHIIFWGLPVIVFSIILRAQIVRAILGTGLFGWTATRLTIACFALFVVSFVAQALVLLFMRGFNAVSHSVVPVLLSVFSGGLAVLFGYELSAFFARSLYFQNFLTSVFRVDGVPGAQVLMLPLAYSLGIFFNLAFLVYYFQKKFDKFFLSSLRGAISYSSFASIIAGVVAYEFMEILGIYLDLHTLRGVLLQGAVAGAAAIITWWLILEVLRNDDVREVRRAINRRIIKSGMILPGKEGI